MWGWGTSVWTAIFFSSLLIWDAEVCGVWWGFLGTKIVQGFFYLFGFFWFWFFGFDFLFYWGFFLSACVCFCFVAFSSWKTDPFSLVLLFVDSNCPVWRKTLQLFSPAAGPVDVVCIYWIGRAGVGSGKHSGSCTFKAVTLLIFLWFPLSVPSAALTETQGALWELQGEIY